MFLKPHEFDNAHFRFNRRISMYFERANRRCESLSYTSNETSFTEMYVQERSLLFLDLALPSRRSMSWKKYSKLIVCECFPTLTKEFFMIENVEHGQGLARLNNNVAVLNNRRFLHFETHLRKFFYYLVNKFEEKLLESIWSKGSDEKKQILYRYLRSHGQYDIDRRVNRFQLLVFHCTNPPLESELTVRMLRTFCDTDKKKCSSLCSIADAKNLETLLCHAGEMRFEFWGMWNGSSYLADQMDFVAAFLKLGACLECAIVLLKFGFPYISDGAAFRFRCTDLQNIKFHEENRVIRTVQPLIEEARGDQNIRMMLIIDTFTIFCGFHGKGVFEDGVRTLVCLTRSLPEPYVTPSELYSTMQQIVVPEFMPSLKTIVNQYTEANCFDDKYDIITPRRLMHLCRVVIRKRLVSNFKLLNGIEDLVIPTNIKRYLKLENFAAESTRINLD